MIRKPAVAGYFYPGDREDLVREIESYVSPRDEKISAIAVIVPHAGYMYSGHVAGEVYASVTLPETFIILCPNHTGLGSDFDVYPEGEWLTPLGKAEVDEDLCAALMRRFSRAVRDGGAHIREHSLEVQLPFLQYIKGKIRFLPICVRQFQYEYLEELGFALAEVVKSSGKDVLIVSSTDMSHYESQESANQKDRLAVEQIEKLDPRGLYDTIHSYDISMCGYLPTTAAMIASKELGAQKGTLLKYATSGDVTRDYESVVGYAGMALVA